MTNPLAPFGGLYYTDGCHLCDDASTLLHECGIKFEKTDIMSSDALIERYRVLNPVFKTSLGNEVYRPFNAAQLENALQK